MSSSSFPNPSPPSSSVTNLLLLRHGETSWNSLGLLQGQEDIPLNEIGIHQAEASGEYFAEILRDYLTPVSSTDTPPSPPPGTTSPTVHDHHHHHPAVIQILQANKGIQAMYSSDLDRAHTTATIISKHIGSLPVTKDIRLRETHLGIWQGKTWSEVTKTGGNEHEKWKTNIDYRMEGGETIRERTVRVACALRDIVNKHPGETVMIVSHGGIMDELGRIFLGKTYGVHTGLHKPNTCICIAQFQRSTVPSTLIPSPDEQDYFSLARLDPAKVGAYMNGQFRLIEWGIVDHLRKLQTEIEIEDKALQAILLKKNEINDNGTHTSLDGVSSGTSAISPTNGNGVTVAVVMNQHRNDEEEAVSV